jgi:hypothetical protein
MTIALYILLGVLIAAGAQTVYSIFVFPRRDGIEVLGRLSREGKKGAIYASNYSYLARTCPFMTKNQLHAGAVKMTDIRVSQLRKASVDV